MCLCPAEAEQVAAEQLQQSISATSSYHMTVESPDGREFETTTTQFSYSETTTSATTKGAVTAAFEEKVRSKRAGGPVMSPAMAPNLDSKEGLSDQESSTGQSRWGGKADWTLSDEMMQDGDDFPDPFGLDEGEQGQVAGGQPEVRR